MRHWRSRAAEAGGLSMISKLYGRWMTAWETALTMRDELHNDGEDRFIMLGARG